MLFWKMVPTFYVPNLFHRKYISSLLNYPFSNNIAILESKIIYFRLRPNFCGFFTDVKKIKVDLCSTENSFYLFLSMLLKQFFSFKSLIIYSANKTLWTLEVLAFLCNDLKVD